MKKIFSLFVAALFCASMFADKIYFKAEQDWWNWIEAGQTATAIYAWGDQGEIAGWPGVRMTKVVGEDFVWEFDLDAKYTNVIFVRVNKEGDFTEKGLKTKNLTVQTDGSNLYTVTAESVDWSDQSLWDNGIQEGEWGIYVPAKFFATGDSALVTDAGFPGKQWSATAIKSEKDTLVLSGLKADQEYRLKVIVDGNWSGGKVKGYDDLSEKPEGLSADKDRNIVFKLAEAGEVKVVYTSELFKLIGDFYVKPVILKDLFLVPNQWADDDAKIAAWVWDKEGEMGSYFTAFFAPKAEDNDTLVAKVNAEADSIIFVRFNKEAAEAKWNGGEGYQWNQTANDSIQWEKGVLTILPGEGYYSASTWDAYIPLKPIQFYIAGTENLVGAGLEWLPDAIEVRANSYTFENLPADYYKLKVTLDGAWSTQEDPHPVLGYDELTDKTDAGLLPDNARNICFRLLEPADVTVTYNAEDPENIVFTVTTTGSFFSISDGYYLAGIFNGENEWGLAELNASKKFELTEDQTRPGQMVLRDFTLTLNDQFKVAKVEHNSFAGDDYWYGSGAGGGNFIVSETFVGKKDIYFIPTWQDDWNGYIWVTDPTPTAVDNTAAEGKVVKMIENGQVIVVKNGVKYNVIGSIVK